MRGSDPIYQYDQGLQVARVDMPPAQQAITLEPICAAGGGSPQWTRWLFDNVLSAPSLAFAYAQAGQENSFGWARMREGFIDQAALLAAKTELGQLRVETLAASAEWFRSTFPVTPATAVTALSDWQDRERRSLWYQSRFYRCSLLWDDGYFRVRDIHKFDQSYAERYLTEPCRTATCVCDTLPVVEGFLWSGGGILSGLALRGRTRDGDEKALLGDAPVVEEPGADQLSVCWGLADGGGVRVSCRPAMMTITCTSPDWWLELPWRVDAATPFRAVRESMLVCRHAGCDFRIRAAHGTWRLDAAQCRLRVLPEAHEIELAFA